MHDRLSIIRRGSNRDLYSTLLNNAFDKALALDGKIGAEVLELEGMSGRNYRVFINNLICSLPNARYLEVGCWAGSTACSAMYGNSVKMLCIDNWSQFGGPRDRFFSNIEMARNEHIDFRFIESDFRNVDYQCIGKFNCYLFDGPHEKEDQFDGLDMALPALDDEFVFIVDDWNWPAVREGTLEAIASAGLRINSAIEVRTTQTDEHAEVSGKLSDWHNGYFLSVLAKY